MSPSPVAGLQRGTPAGAGMACAPVAEAWTRQPRQQRPPSKQQRRADIALSTRRGVRACVAHYAPRQPEHTVLHRVVREHLETFLAEARQRGGGEGLPLFVEREFREFLTCGVLDCPADATVVKANGKTGNKKPGTGNAQMHESEARVR